MARHDAHRGPRDEGLLKRFWKWLAVAALLALCALLLGTGYAWTRVDDFLPSLEGGVWAMEASGGELVMALTREDGGGCLIRSDTDGRVLSCTLPGYGYYEDARVLGDTVYALYTVTRGDAPSQTLCAFSLEDSVWTHRTLLELEEPGPGAVWNSVCPEEDGAGGITVFLTGIDRDDQGWQLRWNAGTGETSVEQLLSGEELFALKRVGEGHYVWIDRKGQAGQEVQGIRWRNILKGLSRSPHHISVCGGRCFLSGSVDGNVYEVDRDGGASVWRKRDEMIGSSGYSYGQLGVFTTYEDGGAVRLAGICTAGGDRAAAGETFSFSTLDAEGLRLSLLWHCARRGAVLSGAALVVLAVLFVLMFCSHRLAVRFSACEIVTVLVLMVAITLVQLLSFSRHLQEDAGKDLQMLGESLASILSSQEWQNDQELAEAAELTRRQLLEAAGEDADDYAVSVYWLNPDGVSIVCDPDAPAGYLAEDVKSQDYLQKLSPNADRLNADGGVDLVQGAGRGDYLYVAPFTQGDREGLVAVSQSVAAVLADTGGFLAELLPVLMACPVVFLVLIIMTRRLLRPLDEIRRWLSDFRRGSTIPAERMPRTELKTMTEMLNDLSVATLTDFNELEESDAAYARLVPNALLEMLGKKNIRELSAGDRAEMRGALLVLLPLQPLEGPDRIAAFMEPAARTVEAGGGAIMGRDGALGAVTAVFPGPETARACAWAYLTGGGDAAGVITGRVELGVFGSEKLLCLMTDAPHLARRQRALSLLMGFGAVMVECGEDAAPSSPRLLGWDDGAAYYEDTSFRDSEWQTCWQEASPHWDKAMGKFQAREFADAMRDFARVLRILPGTDGAACWYVFRCDSLRDSAAREGDTWLLFDWREEHGTAPS